MDSVGLFTRSILILTCVFSGIVLDASSYINSVYGVVFGNHDVRADYKRMAYQALAGCGVKNSQEVPIKQMNNTGSLIAGTRLSSFTAYGIWLDQECLDRCTPDERTFQIYHEAAHYILMHHQKLVAGSVVGLMIAHGGLAKMWRSLCVPGALMTASALMVGVFAMLVAAVQDQEKSADLMAAQVLMKIGKKEVVERYLAQLKGVLASESEGLWWPSNKDRIAYLELLVQSGK